MAPYRRLFGYIRRYKRAFVNGLICSCLTTAITLASPVVLQHAIDDLTQGVTVSKLVLYGLALLAIGVGGGIFRFWTRRILVGASRWIEYDMRNDFFAHLQAMPASYFHTHRTGDLMSRATNDLGAVRMMIGPSIMYSSNTILTFVAALSMMIALNARLTALALIPLPFVSFSVWYFGRAIHRGFERVQAQLSEVSAVAQEALSGVRVVRAYRQEEAEIERFRAANVELLNRNRSIIAIQGLVFPCMTLFLGMGSMLVLWLGGRDVIAGRLTLGQFVAFFAYVTMLSWPMIAFGWVANMMQRGMASWKRMLEVLDTTAAIADETGAHAGPPSSIRGEIEFKDLSFAYGPTPVLTHVSAKIAAGQSVAIVGPTGSGKSTLLGLLARLHDPPPGTVFVDGVDVRALPLATLRGAIGFVPQEPFLFSDTIADNVAFGLDALDPDARARRLPAGDRQGTIEWAAGVARLDKDLADFPKGYDTMVGERGITLSGGQKQRAAIARALVLDAPILILDDSLSAVDTYTEEEILGRLRGIMRSPAGRHDTRGEVEHHARTSIIVSHRVSTVRGADQILVLDRGRIVERGTHDELIRHNGLYAELHKKQLLEEELAAS